MFHFSCLLAISLSLFVSLSLHLSVFIDTTYVSCTLYIHHKALLYWESSGSVRITQTYTGGVSSVGSLQPCQGISHDQSQSFVSPGVIKVKTERRRRRRKRRLEGNVVGSKTYMLLVSKQNGSKKKRNDSSIVALRTR